MIDDIKLGSELERLAAQVALDAPTGRSSFWKMKSRPKKTFVRWELVEQIREELKNRNFDWAAYKLRMKLIDRERKRIHGRGLVALDT